MKIRRVNDRTRSQLALHPRALVLVAVCASMSGCASDTAAEKSAQPVASDDEPVAATPDDLDVSAMLNASPQVVFDSWMSTEGHTAMTGAEANIDPKVGGAFKAWHGYISGTTLEVEPGVRIVQAWRTREFPENAPDSRIEVTLTAEGEGCRLRIVHTNIPAGDGPKYDTGWTEHYFDPMTAYWTSN